MAQMGPEESPILGLIPFFHGYGFCVLLFAVASNSPMIIMSRFEEKLFLSSIEKYKVRKKEQRKQITNS